MTLWSVNQVSTALLLIKTYENLKNQPRQLTIALRDAQHWLKTSTIPDIKDSLNKISLFSKREDHRDKISQHFDKMLEEKGTNYCPYESPYYWAAFCIVGQGELKYAI